MRPELSERVAASRFIVVLMILHLFLAFATSPTETSEDVPATPDTSCTIAASVPEADAADVPRNTGVVLYLEGGGCYELQTATFVHDGVLASSEPVDAHWPFASAFHDFSPGDWTLVLSSPLGDLTFAFQVADVIESAPSSPHVQLERAHRTDGSVDIRLQLSVDAEPGVAPSGGAVGGSTALSPPATFAAGRAVIFY